MNPPNPHETPSQRSLAEASSRDLVIEFTKGSVELLRREVGLAKAELRQDLGREIKAAAGLGVAGLLALFTVNAFLAAAVLLLALWLPAWAAALLVTAALGLVGAFAAAFGWSTRVKTPLERTQRTLKEDVRWAKQRWM